MARYPTFMIPCKELHLTTLRSRRGSPPGTRTSPERSAVTAKSFHGVGASRDQSGPALGKAPLAPHCPAPSSAAATRPRRLCPDAWTARLTTWPSGLILRERGGAAAARRAHNPKVRGSNPLPATNSHTDVENPGPPAGVLAFPGAARAGATTSPGIVGTRRGDGERRHGPSGARAQAPTRPPAARPPPPARRPRPACPATTAARSSRRPLRPRPGCPPLRRLRPGRCARSGRPTGPWRCVPTPT